MIPRGLVGLGLDTLDQSTKEIHEALSLYANPSALPSIVHCTQGKDRTGEIKIL
jgi:protein-tyrosine phosphatase